MEFVVSIIIIFGFLSYFEPDFMFWVAVTFFLDPGGYIQTFLSRDMIGGLQLWDVQFMLLMVPLISPRVKIQQYFDHKDNRIIFFILLSFTVIYHVFVYGYVMAEGSFNTLYDFLQYERLTIVGFLSVIPAYIFFRRSYRKMIRFAFITSVLISFLYVATLLTGFDLIPIITMERSLGVTEQRLVLASYGYAWWFIPAAFTILILKVKVQKRLWIYFVAAIIIMAITLTLTRRSIVEVVYVALLVYFIHLFIKERSIFSLNFIRIVAVFAVVLLTVYIVLPDYIQASVLMVQSIFGYFQPENMTQVVDNRVSFDIPQHLARFRSSPYFGYGYDALWYSNDIQEGGLSANDVPLTAALGMFGIVGLSLYSLFYIKLFGILSHSYRVLKTSYQRGFLTQAPYLYIIFFIVFIFLIDRFTLFFMGYFGDLIQGEYRVRLMIVIGFMLGARDMITDYFNNKK